MRRSVCQGEGRLTDLLKFQSGIMARNRSRFFLEGLLLGTAIGTVTGLLIAPRSGRQARQLLKKTASALPELVEDLSTSMQLQAGHLSDVSLQRWDETLKRLREAIAAGIQTGRSEYQTLNGREENRTRPSEPLPQEPTKPDE